MATIKYIFEDHENSNIARLFRQSFDEAEIQNFIYARGCGDIKKKVEEHLASSDLIVVFLDLVVDNKDSAKTYRTLRMSFNRSHKVLIFTIVCAEYVMLQIVANREYLIQDKSNILLALNLDPEYRESRLATENSQYCRTIERFCKLILKKDVIDCVKDTPGAEGSRENELYTFFYTRDCLCGSGECDSDEISLIQKSKELVKYYPASEFVIEGMKEDSIKENKKKAYSVHKELIEFYNNKVEEFRNKGINAVKIQIFEDWSD